MSAAMNDTEANVRRFELSSFESPAAIGTMSDALNERSVSENPLKQRRRRRLVFAMLDSTLDVALLAQALQAVIHANGVASYLVTCSLQHGDLFLPR
jgi:hypothetical protein